MKTKLFGSLVVFAASLSVLWWATSCGDSLDSVKTVRAEPPPPFTCSGEPLGATTVEACPAGYSGQRLNVCTKDGWQIKSESCISACDAESQGKITFNKNIAPIIARACIGCHSSPERYDNYAVAKRIAAESIRRINLPAADPNRMPRTPQPELSITEKQMFDDWREDGYLEKNGCSDKDSDGGEFLFLNLNYIESNILNDLNRLDDKGRQNSRYIILANKYNQKLERDALNAYRDGIHKGLNSISEEDDILKATPIDARRSIYRLDLEAYGFGLDGPLDVRNDWQAVIDTDQFKFESFTNKGLQIKALTGVDRPWMHAGNFTQVSQGIPDPGIYYEILNIPALQADYFADIGLDFQGDFDNFELIMLGFFGSPISLNKNRMISRHETDDGWAYITYDPDATGGDDRNYFQNPLLANANGQVVAVFDASEVITTLPNGLSAYSLWNAVGVRQNEAPLDVVIDTENPFSPIISNGLSCFRCHNQGLIPATDQIRNSVIRNASEFAADDVELVKAYFKKSGALAATFQSDLRQFSGALGQLDVSVINRDPVNNLTDSFRKDWTFNETATWLFMTNEEFTNCLDGSAILKGQIGQLLTGGVVSQQQLVASFPNIVADCRLGLDPIDQ